MAIDTAEKRRSAAGVPFLPLGPGVTPDATKDAEWRKQAGWGYAGADAVVGVTLVIMTRSGTGDEYTRSGYG